MVIVAALGVTAPPAAATELILERSGVGVNGSPTQLSGALDANGNGRGEIVVEGRYHFSVLEEDDSPRRFRELARVEAPDSLSELSGVTLVDIPGTSPALLVNWSGRLELRDAQTLALRSTLPDAVTGDFGTLLGDVDGDGLLEIVVRRGGTIRLLDPITLSMRGEITSGIEVAAIADIVGDERAEIISNDARAYTVSQSGSTLAVTEVWNAGLSGNWKPYVITLGGHEALVLHEYFGSTAQLATFQPTPALRLLAAPGSSFQAAFADANGDDQVDLITITGAHRVHAIDIASGETLWEADTVYQEPHLGSAYSPIAADLNGDGTTELVWSDGPGEDSGVVAASMPLTEPPRWRSDFMQSDVADWTLISGAGGTASVAYLTRATSNLPSLGTLGILQGSTLAELTGSALAWLPGYNGVEESMQQHGICSLRQVGLADAIAVVGAQYPLFGGDPIDRWLWTFNSSGELQSSRTLDLSINPQRIEAAQALDRPEKQLVVAGWMPISDTLSVRVEIVDYATGELMWQSVPLPTYDGAPVSKLELADLDADGKLEVIVAYGATVAVLKPSLGTDVLVDYAATQFSLLNRGHGDIVLATLNQSSVAFYTGLTDLPQKVLDLSADAQSIALFESADGTLMFATGDGLGVQVRSYVDGQVLTASSELPGVSLSAVDLDGDSNIELIGSDGGGLGRGFKVWRVLDDGIFANGFEAAISD